MRKTKLETMKSAVQGAVDAAVRQGAAGAKVRWWQTEFQGASFEAGRLKGTDTGQSEGFTITVLRGDRRAVVSGTRVGDLTEMVTRAVELATAGSVAHFAAYPEAAPVHRVLSYCRKTASLTRDALIDAGKEMVDRLQTEGGDDLYISASARSRETESVLATSGGVLHESEDTSWSLDAGVQRTVGTDMLFAGYDRGWRQLNDLWDPVLVADRVVEDLHNGRNVVEAPLGSVTVLFPPEVAGMLLQPLIMGVNGRNVERGDSPLRGRIGEKLLASCLTVVDDPHCDFSLGAREVDDDGIPTRRIPIIRSGVLEAFLYDLDTAGMAGVEPTGNNHCSPYDLVVEPGDVTGEQMVTDMADGLVVKSLLGFGQTNMMNGDFAGNVALGFRVQNGEIVGRVKNTMVAGNLYELLSRDVDVSVDVDPVSRMPWLRLDGVAVSASQG